MPITSIDLKINGTSVPLTGDVTLNEIVTYSRNEPRRFSFIKETVLPELTDTWVNATVELRINSTLLFWGRIRNREQVLNDSKGYAYLYQAVGMEFLGDDWPVVSPFDGTGQFTFNLDTTDQNYDIAYAGKSLGQMIRTVLEEPNTVDYFRAHRIGKYVPSTSGGNTTYTIDSRTITDLSSGYFADYFPTKPVTFQGDNLFQAIRGILQSAAPNHGMWFEYVSENGPNDLLTNTIDDGEAGGPHIYTVIRFSDYRTRTTTKTIEVGTHPAPQLRRDYSNSFSRVIVRGGPNVQPVILDKSRGDLVENFEFSPFYQTNLAAKQAWNLKTWLRADNQQITGTCLCRRPRTQEEINNGWAADDARLTDASWLLVNPDNNALTWATNQWIQTGSGQAGFLYVTRLLGTGNTWQQLTNRRVVSNTALTANGTSYLQLDAALPNTLFDKFTMTAAIWPGSLTWRRYKILAKTVDGKSIAKYAQAVFPERLPWLNGDGTALSWTKTGVAQILYSDATQPETWALCGFAVDRLNEAIILDRPSVTFFGTQSSLNTGGENVGGQPTNLRVLLPVALTPLEAIVPANVSGNPAYEGTCKTIDNIEKTLIINYPEWVSENDQGQMDRWARQILDSVKDTVIEGTATVYDYDPVIRPNIGMGFNESCYATNPYTNWTTDVASCLVRFNHDPNGILYHTEYGLSNKRDQYRGYEGMVHPYLLDPGSFTASAAMFKPVKVM